jgi:hypothetical protein
VLCEHDNGRCGACALGVLDDEVLPSMAETQELVVPKSIPTAGPMKHEYSRCNDDTYTYIPETLEFMSLPIKERGKT